jgi:hypothetical protein
MFAVRRSGEAATSYARRRRACDVVQTSDAGRVPDELVNREPRGGRPGAMGLDVVGDDGLVRPHGDVHRDLQEQESQGELPIDRGQKKPDQRRDRAERPGDVELESVPDHAAAGVGGRADRDLHDRRDGRTGRGEQREVAQTVFTAELDAARLQDDREDRPPHDLDTEPEHAEERRVRDAAPGRLAHRPRCSSRGRRGPGTRVAVGAG